MEQKRNSSYSETARTYYLSVETDSLETNYSNNDKLITVYPDYMLSVTSNYGGNVLGSGTYANNSYASISAIPSSGYQFEGWYEDGVLIAGLPQNCELAVNRNRTLEARFKKTNLEISKVSITGELKTGKNIEFTATANGGTMPYSWSYYVSYNGKSVSSELDSTDNTFKYKPEKEGKPYYFSSSNSDCDCYKEHKTIYSNKTLAMQEFQQIIISVLSDGFVSDKEATALLSWMKTHSDLKGYYPFDKLFDTIDTILIDMKVDNEEEKILLEILDAFVSPQTSEVKAEINGKSICLSGDFVFGSKKDVENYLTSRGAVVVSSVTKKVNILILGESGSAAWKYGNYGSKYEKGASIIIYKEKDILGD